MLLSGSNPQRGAYERRLEIYSPAYLFNGDGTAALRPTVTGLTPESVSYGSPFDVQTPDAADIASVVLVRLGTPTHSIDMEQRLVGAGLHRRKRRPECHGTTARQHRTTRLLHVVRAEHRGCAVYREVREGCCRRCRNQAPVAAITSPAGNVTVNPGGVVSFAGSGTDADGSVSTV